MRPENKRAVVLWTGGKDCNLALYEAKNQGYDIIALISFNLGNSRFRAHPVEVMENQAKALGIPHKVIPLNEPFKDSYENAILKIKVDYQIETIITGDIAEIHGNTNWITERSRPSCLNVVLPLWHLDRNQIMDRLFSLGFKFIFSCVKEPWFTLDWLGREIDHNVLVLLREIHTLKGLDICGEQGEYHTLVLNGPLYRKKVFFDSFTCQKDGPLMYMEFENISLIQKEAI